MAETRVEAANFVTGRVAVMAQLHAKAWLLSREKPA
jgi:hypothetical protein